jgi:hypothetical protein
MARKFVIVVGTNLHGVTFVCDEKVFVKDIIREYKKRTGMDIKGIYNGIRFRESDLIGKYCKGSRLEVKVAL